MRLTTVTAVLAALCLGACGDDDAPDPVTSAPTAPPPAASSVPPETPGVTSAPPVETPTEAPTEAQTAEPPKGGTIEGLPTTTPVPGPPVKFRITITDDAISANAETIPEHRDFKIFVYNKASDGTPFTLRSHGNIVGAGFIERGDDSFVLVRNLLPGPLKMASGKLRGTVQVLPAD